MYDNFYYDSLEQFLDTFSKNGINFFKINIPVSIERGYYNGQLCYLFFKNLKTKLLGSGKFINFHRKEFFVESIQLDVGDILNRHNWYYRYCTKYMLENNINEEYKIPPKIRKKFEKLSYKKSKEQGQEWFSSNIEAINQLLPLKHQLFRDFKINKEITTLYAGDENHPKVEYICHNYWLNHKKYPLVEKAMDKLCSFKNSLLERSYNSTLEFYFNRKKLNNEDKDKFPDFFIKQSKKYLKDEAVGYCILHNINKNILEFYVQGQESNITKVFRGKKAQKDPIIQRYLRGPLKGADQRKFVSVKLIEQKK
ncbi:hypothetical protein ACFL0U_01230 [Pseudomonadota bacterium]